MQDYYLTKKKYVCRDTQETCIGYSNYLQTEHWKRFRDSIIKERKKCQCCGIVADIMNVHHISYRNVGKEKKSDVALLCPDCHTYIHEIKNGNVVCTSERILRLVKKPKRKKPKKNPIAKKPKKTKKKA
jgi:phage terminase large subunit GpA-like protein